MNRNEMIDRIISQLGFEHPLTIQFCNMCDTYENNEWNNSILEGLYKAIMEEK